VSVQSLITKNWHWYVTYVCCATTSFITTCYLCLIGFVFCFCFMLRWMSPRRQAEWLFSLLSSNGMLCYVMRWTTVFFITFLLISSNYVFVWFWKSLVNFTGSGSMLVGACRGGVPTTNLDLSNSYVSLKGKWIVPCFMDLLQVSTDCVSCPIFPSSIMPSGNVLRWK
jgi:hypothetical protein